MHQKKKNLFSKIFNLKSVPVVKAESNPLENDSAQTTQEADKPVNQSVFTFESLAKQSLSLFFQQLEDQDKQMIDSVKELIGEEVPPEQQVVLPPIQRPPEEPQTDNKKSRFSSMSNRHKSLFKVGVLFESAPKLRRYPY